MPRGQWSVCCRGQAVTLLYGWAFETPSEAGALCCLFMQNLRILTCSRTLASGPGVGLFQGSAARKPVPKLNRDACAAQSEPWHCAWPNDGFGGESLHVPPWPPALGCTHSEEGMSGQVLQVEVYWGHRAHKAGSWGVAGGILDLPWTPRGQSFEGPST